MSLHPHDWFGPYVVVEWLGDGGTSEVYRVHDARLGRDVALKLFSAEHALDPQRLQRFQREARTLAALNHPNIATLIGVEEIDGIRAIVMELIEGETLVERLQHGPLTLAEGLGIGRQIADALEAAHEQGIIHRDLKPANVMLRADGHVKLLDFGLAKTLPEERIGAGGSVDTVTITGPIATVLGTAAYMSPEQARGTSVDRRTDIWAFGCLLYEMLTGRRAFAGATTSDVIANVINRDPDFTALPADTPPAIRRVIRRCLRKDANERLRDIADARMEIEEASAPEDAADSVSPNASRGTRLTRTAVMAAVVAAVLLLVVTAWVGARRPVVAAAVSRFVIAPPPTLPFVQEGRGRSSVAISADGLRLAFRSAEGAWVIRTRDTLAVSRIGGDGVFVNEPIFSPDGAWIAFFEAADSGVNVPVAEIRKIPVGGGAATVIARTGSRFLGGVWEASDAILFAVASGVYRVAASGGEPVLVAAADPARGELTLGRPDLLPGGRWLLLTVTRTAGDIIALLDLQTGERRMLMAGTRARYDHSGRLVYFSDGALRAIAFDLDRLETRGSAVAVIEGIAGDDFAVSAEGTLVYVSGDRNRELVWVDRQGREEVIPAPPRPYVYPRLSPDGRQIALDVSGANRDIWLWHLERETLTRLTSDPAEDLMPVWTPDGTRIAFGRRERVANLYWQRADGSGTADLLLPSKDAHIPLAFTPDGSRLVFAHQGRDMFALSMNGAPTTVPLFTSAAIELNAELSPDGRWIAYMSNESGQFEVYVRPFGDASGGKTQISNAGGTQPVWARHQREIFYRAPDGAVMGVPVTTTPALVAGQSVRLVSNGNYAGQGSIVSGRTYDVSPDARRFLMLKAARGSDDVPPASIVVVQNWQEELRRLVPLP